MLSVRHLVVEAKLGKSVSRLVDDVSFDLAEGDSLAIVGESGCGKSMTALSLMKILPAPVVRISSGEILFLGEDLVEASEKRMRALRNNAVSMIFQDPVASLNPVHRVGDQIIEAIRSHKDISKTDARKMAIDLMRDVQVPDPERRMRDYPHRLSGGQCQRIMIAMALASKPRLLIADEPTTALDTTVQAQVMAVLKEMQQVTRTAIILITHNLALAASAANWIMVMYAGRVVERGPAKEVLREPKHPYTIGLLRAMPSDDRELDDGDLDPLTEIKGTVPRPSEPRPGCGFAPRCPRAQPRCFEVTPPLLTVGDDRQVACLLFSDGDAA